MLKEYCLWDSMSLPRAAIKFKVARPSVLGVPKEIWQKWQNRGPETGYNWKDYQEDYIRWIWSNTKARERLKLIAKTANRHRKRDVFLGCYCKDMPCHRFTLLSFLKEHFDCKVNPEAIQKYQSYWDTGGEA